MRIYCSILIFFWGAALPVTAQEVTPTFSFTDGLYFSYDEFVRNEPTILMDKVESRLVTNPRTWITQVASLVYRSNKEAIAIDELWGMCIDGIPYIRIPMDSIEKPLPAFAGLRITGNLCYVQYERTRKVEVEMSAYNPLTGKPFRSGTVIRNLVELRERLLRFETGEMAPFSRAQLIQWTTSDPLIQTALRRLSADTEDLEDQLYNIMLSFNKRHPVFIKD